MKKILVFLLTFAMLFALTACGKEEPAATEKEVGKTFDVGEFTVYVPVGWKEFPAVDVSSEEGAIDTAVIQIIKDGKSDTDIYTKPYMRLSYFGEDIEMYKDKSFYDDVVDLEPVVAGEHTWEAFSCTSIGHKMTILWLTEGVHEYQAVLYTDADEGTVSATDADVLEILASVTPN